MEPTKRFVKLIEKFFPYRFKLAKFTHIPFFRFIIKKMLFDKNDVTILTKEKVVEIKLNKEINPPDNIVLPSKVVEHFIEKSSYRFIMDFCLCREAMDCKNYPIELGCIFMGESARNIPKELGRSATKKEALKHVEKCRKAGLVHLIGRDKLDETWLGVGSKIPLVTICNCCNCCCLWRMLPNLNDKLSSTVKKMPGVEIKVNENCTACGKCTKNICFVDAIKIKNGIAKISDDCRGCGRCVEICPNDAIELIIKDDDFINKTIERIKKAVS